MPLDTAIPKHQLIAETIREQILSGKMTAGQAIPSYRALMESYGTTVGTVRQAMLALQADGLIDSVPGVGSVVAKPAVDRHMVGIALVGHADGTVRQFLLDELTLLHDELDRLECDVAVRFVPTASAETISSLLAWVKRLNGVLLTGRIPAALVQEVADTGTPTVQIGEPVDAECPAGVSSVTIDVFNVVHLAISHLVSLGHRRIGFCSFQGSRYYNLLTDAFRRCMAEYGIADLGMEKYLDRDHSQDLGPVPEWLAGLAEAPTALLVEGGTRASDLVTLLGRTGWPVPDRMSIIGITAATRRKELAEGVSCVVGPTHDLILRATQMIPELIRSGARVARKEVVHCRFIPGRTCRNVSDAG